MPVLRPGLGGKLASQVCLGCTDGVEPSSCQQLCLAVGYLCSGPVCQGLCSIALYGLTTWDLRLLQGTACPAVRQPALLPCTSVPYRAIPLRCAGVRAGPAGLWSFCQASAALYHGAVGGARGRLPGGVCGAAGSHCGQQPGLPNQPHGEHEVFLNLAPTVAGKYCRSQPE